jgi:hypothetical protein
MVAHWPEFLTAHEKLQQWICAKVEDIAESVEKGATITEFEEGQENNERQGY